MGGKGSGRQPAIIERERAMRNLQTAPIDTDLFLPNYSGIKDEAKKTSPTDITVQGDNLGNHIATQTISGANIYSTANLSGVSVAVSGANVEVSDGGKLRVYSAGNKRYMDVYHAGGAPAADGGMFVCDSGDLVFKADNGYLEFDIEYGTVTFKTDGTSGFSFIPRTSVDELRFCTYDNTGNNIIFTNSYWQMKNHDHGLQTNPTIYIQSDTNPDSDNTQWLSLHHDKTHGQINTGKGALCLSGALLGVILPQITDGSAANDSIFVSGAQLVHKDNGGTEHMLD